MLAKRWLFILVFLFFVGMFHTDAQVSTTAPRITQAMDVAKLVVLSGTVHPLARPQYDHGLAPAGLRMNHMLLVLKRSPQQEAALDSLLAEQQDPTSPNYHKWLTPAQFGAAFGPSGQDIAAIKSWLQSQGFVVNYVSAGRTVIDFSGTAATVQAAFHTAIHRYILPDGREHWANSTDIEIPAALAPVVAGIRSLNNFFPKAVHHAVQSAFTYNFGAACASPTDNNCYDVGPADFDTIYNVPAAATGAGETIAIVSDSDVSAMDLTQFRSAFGLQSITLNNSGNPTNSAPSCASSPCFIQFVPPTQTNPGIMPSGNESEAILDVEWAGALAPAANIWLVSSADSGATFGGDLSASYIVNCDSLNPNYSADCTIPGAVPVPAQVLSDSYGKCESVLGSAGNTFYANTWSQAAAEGITVVVATLDSGSAACDASYNPRNPLPQEATLGLAVNGAASTPDDTAVGGTDFNQASNPSQFWSASNSSAGESALGYIPETTWNDSCTNAVFGADPILDCNSASNSSFVFTLGAGGGPSSCATFSGSNCSAGYPKPSWQTALTPADGVRDVPDLSLFASNGFSGSAYIMCEADTPPPGQNGTACSLSNPPATGVNPSSYQEVGGTSVAAQAFAGIAALIDQQAGGGGQGRMNDNLYALASTAGNTCASAANPASTCVFYDITAGTISQPCAYGASPSPNCVGASSSDAYGALGTGTSSSFSASFDAAVGYDYATGLGSVNVANLICAWPAATAGGTTTSLQALPSTITSGQNVTFTATVAQAAGICVPTGTVNFLDGATVIGSGTLNGAGLATFQTTSLAVGAHSITAAYQGSGNFATSTSTASNVQVNAPPDFLVSATPSSQTVTAGQSTSYTLMVTPLNGSTQAVSISCSGAPTESTCTAATSPVTLNGTTAQQVTINVTTTAASLLPPVWHPFSDWRAPALFASFMLLCWLIADRFARDSVAVRRWLAGAACAIAITFVLVGCGGGNKTPTNSGTPAGNYTLTITGTAGGTTHTTTVGLVVH